MLQGVICRRTCGDLIELAYPAALRGDDIAVLTLQGLPLLDIYFCSSDNGWFVALTSWGNMPCFRKHGMKHGATSAD